MNNKQYKQIENHYNKLVKNRTIKTFNDALIYKLAIDKAFSLCGVGNLLNELKSIDFDSFDFVPNLKLFYDGSVSYDGNTYKDISDLIDNYQKLK